MLKVVMVVALVTATVMVGCSHGDNGDKPDAEKAHNKWNLLW